jgi:hypothetical protein
MRILSVLLALAFLAGSCSSPPVVIPTRNLEHPSDMTFVCVQAKGTVISGQPMDACHKRDVAEPVVILSGNRNIGTFAFIANPGRDEIAVADMDQSRLLDLTPLSPGYGMLPAGGSPEAIASTQDGCWVATANRTSCDFTLLDPARLLAPTFSSASSPATPATGDGDAARRIVVQTPSGTVLRTSVGEVAFLPQPAADPNAPAGCQADATRRAVATFPGCDMVALLDFSFANGSATIASAFYIRSGGFEAAGTEPVCPTDCESASAATGLDAGIDTVDGGSGGESGLDGGDGGAGAAGPTLYLQPLALVPDGTRVYVASLLDTAVTSLDIGAAGLNNPQRTVLADSAPGVTRLRLGLDPYRAASALNADGTTGGQYLRNRGKFLYAFTRDDSIRVLNLDQASPVECDVNIVPSAVANPAQGCFPIGSAPRRPLAQGPGIRIPTFSSPNSPPPIPRDIAFADLQLDPTISDANIHSLRGQFGFVVASNGQVYVLNLDPTGEGTTWIGTDGTTPTTLPATATHSFREVRDVGKSTPTPLAISIAPQRQVLVSDQAFPTTATYSAADGPFIRSFSPDNGTTTNWLDFPDPSTIISRSWDVIWEGALPYATRGSGLVQSAVPGVSAGQIDDTGADFCASGTQTGDVLMFSGCTQNADCQPDDQFTCQVPVSGARGVCLPISSASSADIVNRCGRYLGSRMRYEIAQATKTSLSLRLKLDEVPKTSLNPCQQDVDCRPDVDHGSLLSQGPDGGATADGSVSRGFECVQVHPAEQESRRCVKRCRIKDGINVDSDCRAGHVCESVPGTLPGAAGSGIGFCVEAPPIEPSCFPQQAVSKQPVTSYSVRAGHSFMVYGSSMPVISGVTSGVCQPQQPANPSLAVRIPLAAPSCPDDASFLSKAAPTHIDPLTGKTVPDVFVQNLAALAGSNPCLYQGAHFDQAVSADGNVPDDPHIRAFFQNPQIRFVMTNLDQYAGDLLAIHFELQYGFVPLTVQIPSYEVQVTMGTAIFAGPTKTPESPIRNSQAYHTSFPYLYVVDQGRTALTPGSRGQVLRINPRAGSNEIATFDTTLSGSTPFQLQ